MSLIWQWSDKKVDNERGGKTCSNGHQDGTRAWDGCVEYWDLAMWWRCIPAPPQQPLSCNFRGVSGSTHLSQMAEWPLRYAVQISRDLNCVKLCWSTVSWGSQSISTFMVQREQNQSEDIKAIRFSPNHRRLWNWSKYNVFYKSVQLYFLLILLNNITASIFHSCPY